MISGLSNKHEWSLWQQTGTETGVCCKKNCVVLHAVKMVFWQVYNIVIEYNCIYLLDCGVLGFWIKSAI